MATPTLITIKGQFLKVDGTPESGKVTLQSRILTLYSAGDTAIVPSKTVAELDVNGRLEVTVPATNDPAWTPTGWKYTLVLRFTEDYSVYQVSVPYNSSGGDITLAELIPVGPSVPVNPANYAPLVHNHAAADIVSGTIASARLPIGTTSGTVAAGDHTHSGGGSGGPIAISDVTGLQTVLDTKAPLASPTFTGTVSGITKAMVGLTNVDNTSDTTKNSATATLSNKTLASPVFSGTPTGLTKAHVGLANVDNTADTAKPISTATQTALDTKATITSLASLSLRVTDVELMTPVVLVWNGSAYVESDSARIYVGPNDPGATPNGSVWIDTTP